MQYRKDYDALRWAICKAMQEHHTARSNANLLQPYDVNPVIVHEQPCRLGMLGGIHRLYTLMACAGVWHERRLFTFGRESNVHRITPLVARGGRYHLLDWNTTVDYAILLSQRDAKPFPEQWYFDRQLEKASWKIIVQFPQLRDMRYPLEPRLLERHGKMRLIGMLPVPITQKLSCTAE